MNLKTFSQWLSMFVVLMVAGVSNVFADNKLYIDNFTVKSGSDVEVAINLDNDVQVCAMQASIVLPEGLSVTGYDITSRTVGNNIKGKYPEGVSNVFNITMFNLDNAPYPGSEGAIAKLTLHASPLFEGGEIEVKNVVLSSPDLSQVPCEGSVATVTVDNTIYIETDVTSQFPLDWEGWTGATGYVGWAAPQVVTNAGVTTPACERYDGGLNGTGVVFSRKLTGFANGIYTIELYGAAAYTPDRGFVSDLVEGDETAVYLFAETSAGTVKQYIPAHVADNFNGTGIATAVLEKVEVTDGTVTIGMYKEKNLTNWHVVQIKGVTALMDADDALAAAVARAEAIDPEGEYANLTAVVAENNKKYYTADEYLAAIAAIANWKALRKFYVGVQQY